MRAEIQLSLTISAILLVGSCSMSQNQWEAARVCGANPNDPMCHYYQKRAREDVAQRRQDEAFQRRVQQDQERERRRRLTSSAKPPQVSENERARRRLKSWKAWLKTSASNRVLAYDARNLPSLAWLSSQWCLKNSGDAVPTHYYRVSLLSNGLLQITYSQRDSSSFKYYTYVAINHGYFDLWDASGYSGSLKNERFRRLEKHSESEYAVVYIGKGYPLHSSSQRALPKMAKQKASEIGPEKYIRKPKIFVKCGI